MARKRKMVDTHLREEEEELGPSRTRKRRERKKAASEVEAMVRRLEALPGPVLAKLGLDDSLLAGLDELRRIPPSDARSRQIRFVSRMVGALDLGTLEELVGRLTGTSEAAVARTQTLERWRDRLLAEGDAALDALLEVYPDADRQALRQAVRAGMKERDGAGGGRKVRELFKILRQLDQAGDAPLLNASPVDMDD